MSDLMPEITAFLLAATVVLWASFAFLLGPTLWKSDRRAFYLCLGVGIVYGWLLTRFLASGWLGKPENATTVEALAAAAQALFTVALIVLTVRTVQANAKIADETKLMAAETARMASETEKMAAVAAEQLRNTTLPVILVRFRSTFDMERGAEKGRIWINIHNYGGPATDVVFSFDPPLIRSNGEDIGLRPTFLTGVPVVPPGWDQEVRFDDYDDYIDDLFLQGGRTYLFDATITSRDPYSGDFFPPTTIRMDLRHLSLQPLEGNWDPATEFRDERNWRTDPRTDVDSAQLQRVLESFTEEEVPREVIGPLDQHFRRSFQRAGWSVAIGKHDIWWRAVATKQSGIHQGTSVGASAWSTQATLAFTLRKALDLDAEVSAG